MTPAELRALVAAATPGPWSLTKPIDGWVEIVHYDENGHVAGFVNLAHAEDDADARLTVLAPDLARLCADIAEALERILKPWEKTQGQGGPLAVAANEALAPARAALTRLSELNP